MTSYPEFNISQKKSIGRREGGKEGRRDRTNSRDASASKNLVPENSLRTGIGKSWYRKKSQNQYQNLNLNFRRKIYCCWYRISTGTQNFSDFWWYRNCSQKNLFQKKVSEPVSEKFDTEKVQVSVSEIFGTVKKYRYQYCLTFWVPSHSADGKNGFWKGFLFVDHWFNAAIVTMHR